MGSVFEPEDVIQNILHVVNQLQDISDQASHGHQHRYDMAIDNQLQLIQRITTKMAHLAEVSDGL